MNNACAVILAAGDGTRMKSARPKALCEVLFKPMLLWVADNCISAGITRCCAVLGHGASEAAALLPEGFEHVLQPERKGTGHAASMARDFISKGGKGHVAVLGGDAPFICAATLQAAYRLHTESGNKVTVISAGVENPFGYGRIIRGENGQLDAIVEEKDADENQRAVSEISSGAFWFDADVLLDYFDKMDCNNAQGEYYLTDAVEYIIGRGGKAGAYMADAEAVLGANNRRELALLNETARLAICDAHRQNGVDVPVLDGIIIGPDVKIGPDTRILPGTVLRGRTAIGSGCEIGPNSYLDNAVIGDGCRVLASYIDSSELEAGVRIGPMSNVRPGCVIKSGVKIGDFVETKNSVVGEKTSISHLTYVGDSDVGAGCNIGCGVVTVNYDGTNKHRTRIGDRAFIGCNVNLIAPVKVGDGVYAAAGTTITGDVPQDALVIGRARACVKEGWAGKRGLYRKK